MSDEIKQLIEAQTKAFEDFKKLNDEKLLNIEKKGYADPLLKEAIDKANKDISRLTDELKALNSAARRPTIEVKGHDGSLLSQAEIEQKAAFTKFARKGENALNEIEQKALVSSDDPNGGFLIPRDVSGRIVSKIYETSAMRQVASSQTISTDALEGMYDDGEVTAGKVGETQTRGETSTPTFGMYRIPVTEGYVEPRISQRLVDDAAYDIETKLAEKIANKFARVQENEFVVGSTAIQARGITTYAKSYSADGSRLNGGSVRTVKTGTNGDLADTSSDRLLNVIMALKGPYRGQGKWLLSRQGIEKVRLIKMDGKYLWTPQNIGSDVNLPTGLTAGSLHGYPIIETNDMPAFAAGAVVGVFGNIAEMYQIVNRQGIRTIRDAITLKGWVKYYTTMRWGGDVVNFEAGIYLEASA